MIKQEGDMDEMYPTTLSEKKIQHLAEVKILKHGDDAFAEAAQEINASNSRGNFSLAGSLFLVCRRIRVLQALKKRHVVRIALH